MSTLLVRNVSNVSNVSNDSGTNYPSSADRARRILVALTFLGDCRGCTAFERSVLGDPFLGTFRSPAPRDEVFASLRNDGSLPPTRFFLEIERGSGFFGYTVWNNE